MLHWHIDPSFFQTCAKTQASEIHISNGTVRYVLETNIPPNWAYMPL